MLVTATNASGGGLARRRNTLAIAGGATSVWSASGRRHRAVMTLSNGGVDVYGDDPPEIGRYAIQLVAYP